MKPLACDPQHVKGMSERRIVSHYENNYGGAVKRLNLLEEQLAGLDFATAPTFVVNGLKREQLVAMNSMILHELFFGNLGEAGEPGPGLREALNRDFGSLERWRAEFVRWAGRSRAGSGWVLLSHSARDGRLVNQWASDHAHTLAGGRPKLALDMYEHSVRGADTSRHDLAPQCAGLFAVSVGLSALFADDHELLRHGMVVYDALYAWAKDCQDETHNWPPAA